MPLPSIYSPYDMRYNNPAFNQQTGQEGNFPVDSSTPTDTTAGYTSPLPTYTATPQPTSGQGPYGLVPGTTALPPSTFQQVNTAFPGLSGAEGTVTGNIMSELQGQLSPQVLANMQNLAASYGVRSGMPGSNAIPGSLINNSNLLGNIETTQQLQEAGLKDYLGLIQGAGAQQTPQGLATGLSQANAALKAAPDPTAAANQQLANYYAALNAAKGPAAGTGVTPSPATGTGALAPTPPFVGGTPSPSPFAPTATAGQGSGGVPGQPGLAYNDLTGEYQDTTPIGGFGTVSQDNFGLGPVAQPPVDASNPNTFDFTDPANLDAFYGGG